MVLESIVAEGQVTRGWIGVEPNPISPEMAETFGTKATQGVVITGVLQNGPAATSGIRPGDVVVKVAGQTVQSVPDLLSAVAALKPGKAYAFEIDRQNKLLTLSITPAVRPKPRNVSQERVARPHRAVSRWRR